MATTESSSTGSRLDASAAATRARRSSRTGGHISLETSCSTFSAADADAMSFTVFGRRMVPLLSERIAAWENDVPVKGITYKERMRVYTALKQSHLPKIDEAGVGEYDDARRVSRLTDATADVEYYLGLGVLSSTFVVLPRLGLSSLSSLGGFGWAVLVSGCLVASALAHRYREQSIELDGDRPSPKHQ